MKSYGVVLLLVALTGISASKSEHCFKDTKNACLGEFHFLLIIMFQHVQTVKLCMNEYNHKVF